nr:HNH endonuclease [Priestia flexa]
MQMITPIYNPKVKRYQDPETGRFVANPNVERVEKPVGVEKKGKEVELVRNVESVQDVSRGTVKIDYDLAKEYIRDVESKTGLKLHKSQIEKLKDTLRENKYEKMTPLETLKHRNTFNSVKNKLIKEWEENTRQTWPRYTEEIYDKKGRLARDIGQPYDAHHIIENNFGGPHEWWNIHPAKFPDEHQAGIHGKGAPSNKLFPRR